MFPGMEKEKQQQEQGDREEEQEGGPVDKALTVVKIPIQLGAELHSFISHTSGFRNFFNDNLNSLLKPT